MYDKQRSKEVKELPGLGLHRGISQWTMAAKRCECVSYSGKRSLLDQQFELEQSSKLLSIERVNNKSLKGIRNKRSKRK